MNTISVTTPVSQALTRMRTVLFEPFDIAKWFTIGFCAWLAYLCEGGFHGGGNFGGGHNHGGHGAREELERGWAYVVENIAWIAPLAVGIVLVGFVIGMVMLWLSSRGRFMFLHCVALNTAEVQVPWHKFAAPANSLFLFRFTVALIGMVLWLPLMGGLAFVVLRMVFQKAVTPVGIIAVIGIVLTMVLLGVVLWIIGRLTTDFVVPIQLLRRCRCVEAWRELRTLVSRNLGNFILYLLFRIVLSVVIGVVLLVVVVATCCIAGCLFLIPYIGTVLMLPVLVFERAYSVKYLAQYGPSYDVFTRPTPEASQMS